MCVHRHWPVLVAGCNDLPRNVASGGCTAHPISDSFPQTLREAVPAARPEEAYPVCIFGSQARHFCCLSTRFRVWALGSGLPLPT